ncbi:MAG: GIY-YIG nuclease family protein [Nitrososphaerota archaeon]
MSGWHDIAGVYLLVVEVMEDVVLSIGSLGPSPFPRGLYLYVGSGQGGVMRRLKRYFDGVRNPRWHIDHLLTSGVARAVCGIVFQLPRRYECLLAGYLGSITRYPVGRFGSSDCSCPSHLYIVGDPDEIVSGLSERLGLKPIIYSPSGRPSPSRTASGLARGF